MTKTSASGPVRVGLLSTYQPTVCGLARFSGRLAAALAADGHQVCVVRVSDGNASSSPSVVGELVNGSSPSVVRCAAQLDECDVAVIQHDEDIYGGAHGEEILTIVAALSVPSIVVAHSVPESPAPHQRWVLEQLVSAADRVVVMSDTAQERLGRDYAVERRKVVVIAHGGTIPSRPRMRRASRPTILTWGLMREGKGIERVIDAMAALRDVPGNPRYMVIGQTHPKALAATGESYRNTLVERVRSAGLGSSVVIDGRYYDDTSLTDVIQSVSAVVLPYDSTDQVTSGVLIDALVHGRPVVATAFPHAVELLSGGAGLVVQHDEPDVLTAGLRRVMTQPRIAGGMAAEARRLAPTLAWPVAGRAFIALARQVLVDRRRLG